MTNLFGKAGATALAVLLGAPMFHLQWTDRRAMPMPVAGGAAAFCGTRLIYAGGTAWVDGVKRWLRDVRSYDPATDRWSEGPALPFALAYGASAGTGDALEVLGGSDGEKTHRECWRLEAGATQWKPSGTAPADTVFGRAAVSGGKTYLFGGCADVVDLMGCGDGVHVREADGKWRRVSTLPQGPIAMPAAASVQGKTYFFGGCSMQQAGALKNRDDAYSYDPATNQWKRLRALPHANRGMTAAAANDRFILLYGGYTASVEEAAGKGPEYGFTAAVLAYDIQEDRYRDAGTAPLAAAGVELLYQTGRLYAVGGEQRMKGRSARLMTAGVRQQE